VRGFRKNANPQFYNLRHKPSQGNDHLYYQTSQVIHGPNDEPIKTNRDPTKFKFSNNIFRNDYLEWRLRASDYIYQISHRLHRSNDAWTRFLFAWTGMSFMMFSQALLWKIHLIASSITLYTRIRDKGAEPTLDEVWFLDTMFQNEKIASLFSPSTYHVIDFDQEWEAGLDNPYFPEYRTNIAKFFNTDMNTTEGNFQIGDVESGATATIHFKTMPYSNNKFNFTEPFMVYDMWAEIQHNGEYHTEHIIKAEEHLKTKSIFVLWH
jgi:hypothetical protein